jgi:hypothetical protein
MSAIKYRRPNNNIIVPDDWPLIPKYCTRRCACPGMRWRSRIIQTFGGASPCKIQLVEDGIINFYRRVDCTLEGKWKLAGPDGATVKTCSGSSFTQTSGNLPFCDGTSGGGIACSRPDGFDGVSLIYETTSECVGSGAVNSTVSAEAARNSSTTTTGEWGPWVQGFPTGALAAGGSNDSRSAGSCSFNDKTIEIELGGNFVPFMIRRKEIVTQRFEDFRPSVTTEEIIELPILSQAPFSVVWIAVANQNRSISTLQTLQIV